jgi:hypothetical protein
MQEWYGIDIERSLEGHSARWLRCRITGLLSCESRLCRVLRPKEKG